MKARLSWDHTDLTATVDVLAGDDNHEPATEKEATAIAYGMCGEFWFDQGGHGDMGFPTDVEVLG